eukprot:3413976-Amphidinium_carterae.1
MSCNAPNPTRPFLLPLPYTQSRPTLESQNFEPKAVLGWKRLQSWCGDRLLILFFDVAVISKCVLCHKKTEVDGMLHEGTIPDAASRMTMSDIIMSLGH